MSVLESENFMAANITFETARAGISTTNRVCSDHSATADKGGGLVELYRNGEGTEFKRLWTVLGAPMG